MLTLLLNRIEETIKLFEKNLLDVKKRHKNSNEELIIDVYTSRIIDGKTLEQTGVLHGVTRERVRQIEKNLFSKYKKNLILSMMS